MTNSINLPYHYTVTMIQHTEFTITASDFRSAGCTFQQHNGTRCSGSMAATKNCFQCSAEGASTTGYEWQGVISIGSATFCEREHTFTFTILSPIHLSVVCLSVCLSVICNAHAPYSGGWNFPQHFYGIWYLSHPLTSTWRWSHGNPSAGGVKYNRGSQI